MNVSLCICVKEKKEDSVNCIPSKEFPEFAISVTALCSRLNNKL